VSEQITQLMYKESGKSSDGPVFDEHSRERRLPR